MSVPPDTPVLVGAAAAARLPDAVELMAAAAEAAALDAGVPGLLGHVDRVYVARGSWTDPNPGRPIATRFGAAKVHSVVAELGVLQQTLVTRGCLDVAAGRAEVVLVLGAEAAHTAGGVRLTAGRLGAPGRGGWNDEGPDEVLAPSDDILHRLEVRRGLYLPVWQYAVLESALRAAGGLGLAAHATEVAELWAGFSRVAAGNEDAWARDPVTPADLAASDRNPMMSWPYTRSHCSRAGVDQGAALLLCSARTALRLGVPRDRWVFPVAAAESNVMTPVSTRPDLARSHGFAAVGRRLTEVTGVAPADADLVDLYSCFPAAVRLQLRELGLAGRADLTVTGGMTFAGGPLNNYAFQSTVKMAQLLRAAEPGAHGLVTCVSGMVTKQGGLLWSTAPPSAGFRAEDVSAEVRAAEPPLPLVEDVPAGSGRVAGFTVVCEKGRPVRACAVVTLADGTRTVAASTASDLVTAMTTEEWVGRAVTVHGETLLASG
ncbi:acetyl-CoA acetyltransferase [Pseudofrankia inefficax]|uniref:Acetyl-CoA acetyltransferase n=1 Tax=Pseudofrankia inefficax (strain DSM 45817 / CECT 9037 / DDB 130130 / EuI1c) TaxID=298654 RepID=E3J4Y6_PSEI1|nr:acetyl-CoA acetyltransferase [Pseudofrankia inefficax]ADP79437.1 acetyl-CoA acetyltransferase [Pseudofrankia inefficax]